MASNYTTNYNLCQWQPTDQVQRTDFNADNAKLDAALATKLEKSCSIELPLLEQTQWDRIYDLSGIDWSQWESVSVLFDLGMAYGFTDNGHIRGTVESVTGQVSSYCTNQGSHFVYGAIGPFLLTFLPLHDPGRQVVGVCSGASGLGIASCTFSELASLCINYDRSGQGMPGEAAVTAWGIK